MENELPLSNQRVYKSAPGVWCFYCEGCGHLHCYYTDEAARPNATWQFNGNLQLPTFTPSLLNTWGKEADPNWIEPTEPSVVEGYKWSGRCHIFVTNGLIQWLGDCTHALAGQTRMLPFLPEHLVERSVP
ncbi:MAG TPA: DUF6527 family protein [Bacteroidia bacterium]|nr:DUF6527 family protein [Bacteroidia bacterium]